jgi:hypothetical protein
VVVADEVAGEPVLLASVVAHECGHELLSSESESLSPESDLSGLQSVLSVPWKEWPVHQGSPWAGHDSRWIRAVCHVVHRMKAWGLLTVPAAVADLKIYGMQGSLGDYSAALGDEPAALDWVPLAEALARPAPLEFEELWAADVRRSVGVESMSERVHHEHVVDGAGYNTGSRKPRGRRAGVGVAGRRGR